MSAHLPFSSREERGLGGEVLVAGLCCRRFCPSSAQGGLLAKTPTSLSLPFSSFSLFLSPFPPSLLPSCYPTLPIFIWDLDAPLQSRGGPTSVWDSDPWTVTYFSDCPSQPLSLKITMASFC